MDDLLIEGLEDFTAFIVDAGSAQIINASTIVSIIDDDSEWWILACGFTIANMNFHHYSWRTST